MKRCSKCGLDLPVWCFDKKGITKAGEQIYRADCKSCKGKLDKQYYEQTKATKKAAKEKSRGVKYQYVLEYLRKNPCVDCGENDPIVLEFDHISGQKELSISAMLGRNFKLDTIKAEIEKCVVRCANCHRRKTALDGNYWKLAI